MIIRVFSFVSILILGAFLPWWAIFSLCLAYIILFSNSYEILVILLSYEIWFLPKEERFIFFPVISISALLVIFAMSFLKKKFLNI